MSGSPRRPVASRAPSVTAVRVLSPRSGTSREGDVSEPGAVPVLDFLNPKPGILVRVRDEPAPATSERPWC